MRERSASVMMLDITSSKSMAMSSARVSALSAAGFIKNEITGSWEAGALKDKEYLDLAGWEVQEGFAEVPADLLRKEQWEPKQWGPWKHKEGILILESRALIKSIRRIALSVFGRNIRQLLLADNMSVVLAFERCR